MVDFLMMSTRNTKNGVEIYPKFKLYPKPKDLMIRGGDFYAVWLEDVGLWSTNEDDVLSIIDNELRIFGEKYKEKHEDAHIQILYMWDASNGMIDHWHKYCQKQMRDSFNMLDENLIFSNTDACKENYASKKLNYPLEKGNIDSYDKLISVLYSEEERHKIEWAIGSIVTGESKQLQKFMVLYGASGTGKSTILNIIQQLFDGYYSVFDAKALGMANASFALEPFKTNPLVAIQHDGDLSRIEDNTRLNSLVSHELMTVNEKFKSAYANRFKCFLFMGTNKPVRITDSKSGIIRRLIDVSPTGNKLSSAEYRRLVKNIPFELGAIAYHCKEVYEADPDYYNDYIPISMLDESNDFYNFMVDVYHIFKKNDSTTLKVAWEMYKNYCEDARVPYPLPQRAFKAELKTYFKEHYDRYKSEDGTTLSNYFVGFNTSIFEKQEPDKPVKKETSRTYEIEFKEQDSIFDKECEDCLAQYATTSETPSKKWDNVRTKLKKLNTSKIHYVKIPENHIVIDFDIKDENGNKSYEKNLEAASKWPATYAELSKSGSGIHLHYIFNGDVTRLSRVYADSIEIKVFTGKSSLRRRLTKCNNLPIKTISSGLPMKGEKNMVSDNVIKSEIGIRKMIQRNLNKEIHPGTKPSIDFIYKILEDAYERGLKYDVSDMKNEIYAFAMNSTNQSDYCVKLVGKMHFKSEEPSEAIDSKNEQIVFYDIEVFPNLLLVNWKIQGEGHNIVRMINPTPQDIEELIRYRLVGFNCRRYDNHIIYARLMGYSNEQLYNLSQRIINGEKNAFFGEAYNLSYTDIYDFASAGNKKSLKKLEIEMGIHHKELGLPWDQPVAEDKWIEVAEYCDNDVIATEAAWNYLSADWTARQILADLAGMSVNDTTNTLTTKIIFGNEKKPQGQFIWRDMSQPVKELSEDVMDFLKESCPDMIKQTHGKDKSLLPYFPGYKFENGVSTYRGEEVGEGGYVYAEPGIYCNVALLDIASMHPHSDIAECLFGPNYTRRFRDIVEGRVNIKHEDWDAVNNMLDGKLTPYVQKVINGEMTSKQLANALKTAINSVYGLTAANFDNPFRDIRNKDNIVAKRGALFMVDLKHEVQERGFTVAHIKTDSIKIPNATPEIIQFVMDFGKKYGYTFEHEATYDRMCLVNDAVYICKYDDGHWDATGTQFQIPYVFKTLFSKEPIKFEDMCETKSVTSALYLDMNENLPDVSEYEKTLQKFRQQYNKGAISDQEFIDVSKSLKEEIDKGHEYHFVGKVGNFCPILPGKGGGLLTREKDGMYYAATGSKGYRWLESEMIRGTNEKYVDRSYYNKLVDDAVDTISQYGDFEWFVSDDPYPEDDLEHAGRPVNHVPCGDGKYETCFDCPNFDSDECSMGYNLSRYIINTERDNDGNIKSIGLRKS